MTMCEALCESLQTLKTGLPVAPNVGTVLSCRVCGGWTFISILGLGKVQNFDIPVKWGLLDFAGAEVGR